MASVATTNISNVTRTILNNKGTSLNIGGCPVEVFRIAAGQVTGDTAVLVPSTFSNARTLIGPAVGNFPTTGSGASSVTVTLGLVSSAVTATMGAVDVWLFGPLAQA